MIYSELLVFGNYLFPWRIHSLYENYNDIVTVHAKLFIARKYYFGMRNRQFDQNGVYFS